MKAAHRIICSVVMAILCLLLCAAAWAYGHRYDTGSLSQISISEKYIVMSDKAYRLRPNVKVILKVKQRGAYYEQAGRLSDLRVGDKVFLKVFGPNDVLEIEVLR